MSQVTQGKQAEIARLALQQHREIQFQAFMCDLRETERQSGLPMHLFCLALSRIARNEPLMRSVLKPTDYTI